MVDTDDVVDDDAIDDMCTSVLIIPFNDLCEHEITISGQIIELPIKQRENDSFLMDQLTDITDHSPTIGAFNRCRLYLRVLTLSDICTGDGISIRSDSFHGEDTSKIKSKYKWQYQPKPPSPDWKIWKQHLMTLYNTTAVGTQKSTHTPFSHQRLKSASNLQLEI